MGCVSITTVILFHRRFLLEWLCASHRWRFSPFASACQTRGCTSRMFEMVSLHLSPCQIGSTSDRHQLIMHPMLSLSCALGCISRVAPFLIILVCCRCISVIIHRNEKTKHKIDIEMQYKQRIVGFGECSRCVRCIRARETAVGRHLCHNLFVCRFIYRLPLNGSQWHLISIRFLFDAERRARPRISYSIRFSCQRIIRQSNWNQFEWF